MAASAPGQHPLHHDPIVTATPNPALDVSTSVGRVVPEHKLRCGPTRLDPGGGGINVSRVVRNLGGRSIAVYAVGGPTGQAYRELLEREGIVGRAVRIAASTRESFTVDETDTGKQFRFVLQGPEMREPEWRAFLSAIADDMPTRGYIVPSGSLPPGAPVDFYARIAHIARERGTRCVVDTSGPALRAALDEGVFLIKPSLRELGELVGAALDDETDMQDAAHQLVHAGACDVVALTLGAAGALLVTADGAMRLPTPAVDVQSTVGAGDSFLGALVLRLAQGRDLAAAFRSAVAAGSATAMLPATDLCRLDDVAALEAGLEVVDVTHSHS
jgi:6-phosphofructokinase 2